MAYCARYRFKLLTPLDVKQGTSLSTTIPGLPTVTFELGAEVRPLGHWVTARMDGFGTESEARKAGHRLGDMLLVVGAVTKLAVDLGFSRSSLQFSEAVHAAVHQATGRILRPETHGLMIFEKDTVKIIGVQAHGTLRIGARAFEDRLFHWAIASSALTDRQRNCAALINDSFFVTRTEGQFILRVSAVEALCDQSIRDERYRAAVRDLEQQLSKQTLDDEVRESLGRLLSNAARQSLRQAYMNKFKTLRSDAEAKVFDELYQKRSKLVHDGVGRGTLDQSANVALQLATDLLEADLRNSSSR